jgi:hypothetical protein
MALNKDGLKVLLALAWMSALIIMVLSHESKVGGE